MAPTLFVVSSLIGAVAFAVSLLGFDAELLEAVMVYFFCAIVPPVVLLIVFSFR